MKRKVFVLIGGGAFLAMLLMVAMIVVMTREEKTKSLAETKLSPVTTVEKVYKDSEYIEWRYPSKYETEKIKTTDGRVLVNVRLKDKSQDGSLVTFFLTQASQDLADYSEVKTKRSMPDQYSEEIGVLGDLRGLLFRTADKKERTLMVKKQDLLLMVTMTATSNDPVVEQEFQELLKTIKWK